MEENIKTDISEVVAQSPATTERVAKKNMNFPKQPDGQSTFVTGDLLNNIADQTVTTPSRGIEFDPASTEVYTGGVALPNLKYNTRRQTAEDRGNPLYFEPNYQPVAPFDVETPYGTVQSTTIDPDKLAWLIKTSVAGVKDDGTNYFGYKILPEEGRVGFFSHLFGDIASTGANILPEMAKGAGQIFVGTPAMIGREAVRAEKDYLAEVYGMTFDDNEKRRPSSMAAVMRARGEKPSEEDRLAHVANLEALSTETAGTESVLKIIEDVADGVEKNFGDKLHADLMDNSATAQIARGMGSGVTNLLAAVWSHNPSAFYTLLNFAGMGEMREAALKAGVSPQNADLYSFLGSAAASLLDRVEFDIYTKARGASMKDIFQMMKDGGYKFNYGEYLAGRAVAGAGESAIEMTQTEIQSHYDEEYKKYRADNLAVSAITAFALTLGTTPFHLRHAKEEDRAQIARSMNIEKEWAATEKALTDTLNRFVEEGRLDKSAVAGLKEKIITDGADAAIKSIQEGTLGEFDKVSPEDRARVIEAVKTITPDVISKQEFDALDAKVDEKLKDVKLPDSQKTMIKGVVRGLAQIKLLQNGTAPSSIEVPTFVITSRGDSSYNPNTNTITISKSFSDVDFTKTAQFADTTDVEDFRNYERPNFWASSRQSNRMSSILHELSHWIDYQVGEKGFGAYLEEYYKNIAQVFGKDRANMVEAAVNRNGTRTIGVPPKGMYADESNATEWNAQAVARLGKRAANSLGLGTSQAQRFLSYANLYLNQLASWSDPEFLGSAAEVLTNYKNAIDNITKQNTNMLKDMVDVFGEDAIKKAVQDFINDNENPNESMTEYLARKNMLGQLYDVLDSFADAAGLETISSIFDSTNEITSFVDKGNMYFTSGYDNAVEEIRQKQTERAEKEAQKAGAAPKTTTAKNDVKQVTLSNGQTVSVPKNVQNFGGDKGIDAVRALLNGDSEGGVKERMGGWHGTKWLFDQFKLLMSGKGEGGMAHGYGVYVTTEKKRAKHYWHDIALRDNQVPVDIVYKYWDYEASKFRNGRLSVMDNPSLHEAFMGWYNEFASRHDDADDILWYTREPLLHNGFYPDEYEDASERAMSKAGTLMRYVKKFSKGISDTEQIVDIDFEINKDFGQLMRVMTPDTDLMLHESAERNAQPPKVDEILTAMRPEIETMLTQFYKGQQAKDPDLWSDKDVADNVKKDLDVYDNSDGGDIYNVVERAVMGVNGITNRYDAARQASKFLSDHGIMGNFYFGNVDGMSAVVFDPATLDIMDIIRDRKNIEIADRVNPNDYVADTDPAAEVRQAFEEGKDPVDEEPSYAKKIDGRNLGEDISIMTKGIAKRAKALPNKIVKWFASSRWGWGLDRILVTMFGRDVAEQLDVAGKYTRRNSIRSDMYGRFMAALKPIIGDVTTDKTAAMFKYKTILNQLGFVRVKDVEINHPYNADITSKRDLTGWEVMYVYLMKRMGEKYGNRIQQSTKTDINELIATLTDEEKQFADTMSNTLRSVWVDIVGEDKAVVNYFPILDARHAALDEVNIDTFKQRMETDSPIAIDDAGRIFSKDISRIASWQSGFYQTMKRVRDALQYKGAQGRNIDPDVEAELYKNSAILAGQITNIFGRDGYHNLLRLLDTQIADPQDQMLDSASSKTLQQMGNNVIKGMLSFKFMSLPKNLVNITMMWGGARDQSTYWNSFAEGIADKARTWKYMMKHSNEIRMRYNDAGYNEFLDQRNTGGSTAPIFKGISKLFAGLDWTGDKTGGMAKMSAALDMLGEEGLRMFMLNGDAVANVYGGYGLVKDYMAQGMTEEEAFRKLDRYIVEHQSSSNLAMKPLGQLEANKSLAGQFLAFTSEGVSKGASILGTFDEVNMGTATKSEAIANAMSIAMSMLLFSALGAGVWDLWDDDEKVQEEAQKALYGAMVDQLFGVSVLGNGFLTPAVQGMLGIGGNMGISAPLWSFMTEGVTNLKKGEYDRLATKAMEATGLFVGANAMYNNLQGLMFMNSDDPDIREAGFRMLAGRTPAYAEKRTGAKIRKRNNESVENSDEE